MLEHVLAAFLGSLTTLVLALAAGYGWICLGASDQPKPEDLRRHHGEDFKGGKHA